MSTDAEYKLMRLLAANPGMSQREAARALGMSLGKVNYCLQALVQKGWVKATNFKNSQNKAAYLYVLTPSGLRGKAKLTLEFLKIKMREYEALSIEIEEMRREAEGHGGESAAMSFRQRQTEGFRGRQRAGRADSLRSRDEEC